MYSSWGPSLQVILNEKRTVLRENQEEPPDPNTSTSWTSWNNQMNQECWDFLWENVCPDQMVNHKNGQWLCKTHDGVPTTMHTKFLASLMVLGVMSSVGNMLPLHFFLQDAIVNIIAYTEVLNTVVKSLITAVAQWKAVCFFIKTAPCHTYSPIMDGQKSLTMSSLWPLASQMLTQWTITYEMWLTGILIDIQTLLQHSVQP